LDFHEYPTCREQPVRLRAAKISTGLVCHQRDLPSIGRYRPQFVPAMTGANCLRHRGTIRATKRGPGHPVAATNKSRFFGRWYGRAALQPQRASVRPAPGGGRWRVLTSKTAMEGERKQVTVLFADLKGSMEFLADRDPEEARKILDPLLEHMMDAVHRYE